MHEPQIDDIYEYRYNPAGKRIRLGERIGRDGQYFETTVTEHPQSPQQVGYRSHVLASRLLTNQFAYIEHEMCPSRSTTNRARCFLPSHHPGPHKGHNAAGRTITWGYSASRRPMRSAAWVLPRCQAVQIDDLGDQPDIPCCLPLGHAGLHATAEDVERFMQSRVS